MVVRKTITIYGNSLILAGLEASLRSQDTFSVLHVTPGQGNTLANADILTGMIIYDAQETNTNQFSPWLINSPHLILVGLDNLHNQINVFHSESHRVMAVGDVFRLILQIAGLGTGAVQSPSSGEETKP